jgi:hypothetical protein
MNAKEQVMLSIGAALEGGDPILNVFSWEPLQAKLQ